MLKQTHNHDFQSFSKKKVLSAQSFGKTHLTCQWVKSGVSKNYFQTFLMKEIYFSSSFIHYTISSFSANCRYRFNLSKTNSIIDHDLNILKTPDLVFKLVSKTNLKLATDLTIICIVFHLFKCTPIKYFHFYFHLKGIIGNVDLLFLTQ